MAARNWHQVSNDIKQAVNLAINERDEIFVGTLWSGLVFKSEDNGNNWTKYNPKLPHASINSMAFTTDGEFYASASSGLFRYSANDSVWIEISGADPYSMAINSMGEIFISTWHGIERSTDKGVTWEFLNLWHAHEVAIDRQDNIFAEVRSGFYYSESNGDDWVYTGSDQIGKAIFNSKGDIFTGSISGHIYIADKDLTG